MTKKKPQPTGQAALTGDLLTKNAGFLRHHAKVLMAMPAGEQFIGSRDGVLHSALIQIAECFERLAAK